MKLKKLVLFGFKSFADKTEISFDQGVTCIVGPNGCGKSNVSDAMRWVLGERSAKLLRGSKMEDVIFNGTDFRKPLSVAEVTLTLDNEDRGLPIDYHEVAITRRLYRSGESEYLINKTPCRLKDVHDLVLDTGVGSKSYSMIEQGRIDHILRAAPEERRQLIEEAAGIAKFKSKKDEALRKLARTEDNLQRINDIIREVEKNINYAERQAKKAEKYRVEFEHLKNLEIYRVFAGQDQLKDKSQKLNQSLAQLREAKNEIESKLKTCRKEIEGQEVVVSDVLEKFRKEEGERYGLVSSIEKNTQQLQFLGEKRLELAEQRGQIQSEQEQLQTALESSSKKKIELSDNLESLQKEEEVVSTSLEEQKETVNSILSVVTERKNRLEEVRRNLFSASQETGRTKNEFQKNQAFLENFILQIQNFENKKNRILERLRDSESSLKEIIGQTDEQSRSLGDLEKNLSNVQTQEEHLQHEVDELEASVKDSQNKISGMESRLSVLSELEQSDGAEFKELTAEAKKMSSECSALRDILIIESGYEWAVDIALGRFSKSIVYKSKKDAFGFLKLLRSKPKHGQFGVIIDEISKNIAGQDNSLLLDLGFKKLSSFCSAKDGHQSTFSNYFANVYLADSLSFESLDSIVGAHQNDLLIFKDGYLLDESGKIQVWNPSSVSEKDFSRKKEIERLNADLNNEKWALSKNEKKHVEVKVALSEARSNREDLRDQFNHVKISLESLENSKVKTSELLKSFQHELKLIEDEQKDFTIQSEDIQQKQTLLEDQLSTLTKSEEDYKSKLDLYEAELEQVLNEKEVQQRELHRIEAAHHEWQNKLKHITDSITLIENHEKKDNDRLSFLGEGLEKLVLRAEELKVEEIECHQLKDSLDNQIREKDAVLSTVRQEKNTEEEKLQNLRQQLEDILNSEKASSQNEHDLTMQIKELDYSEQSLIEKVEQKYRLTFSDLKREDFQNIELKPDEELDQKIERLEKKVESLGTVNLLAIEEFEEMKERYDFLTNQRVDLESAREQLLEAIRKINRTTKRLFEETFENVQLAFQDYYQTLFKGGEAKLVLTDEAHPLDSGIDIVVRPPGKKLTHISLLSGGEKALTAVALLFALFRIKPSPFCVLDEVDAPLDEANIDRFLGVLKSFLKESQFIIISHSRKTISMGDALYGVTMQEAGISKIVSVKVGQDIQDLPANTAAKPVASTESSNS